MTEIDRQFEIQFAIDALKECAERIGATPVSFKLTPVKTRDISQTFEEGKPISEIELLTIKQEWKSDQPLIDEHGKPFVLYIHDFTHTHWGVPKRVYHVAWCKTLEQMDASGRRARYVKKSKIHNRDFDVDYGNSRKEVRELPACFNCQKLMADRVAPAELYYGRTGMDIEKFYALYGPPDLFDSSEILYEVTYPNNWRTISWNLRERAKWICSGCGDSYVNRKADLHVHHRDGVKENVKASNLQVLCRTCHELQPWHNHMQKPLHDHLRHLRVSQATHEYGK